MKIFLTGGDGLLGSNLVRELLKKGHELKVLVQPGRQTITLDGLDIERIEGDLLDINSLTKAAEGAEAIYHVAASTSIWPSRNEIVNKVNIEGTQNIITLAKKLEVKKLVYVGTANSFSFGTKEKPGIEGTPYIASKYGLDYMDSKFKAHQLIDEAVKDGVPAVVVNPTFMLGAYDSMPSSGAMVLAVYKQDVPGFAPGGRNYICVKDAAIGIANALDKGRVGESYIIGNKNMSYKEAFTLMAETLKVKPPKIPMPKAAVLAYGKVSMWIFKLTGKKPVVSYPMAKIACDTHYFSAAKAVKELGLPQSPIEEGIKECFDWLDKNGYIK
jgi:dihydroflavonol-4-reductase